MKLEEQNPVNQIVEILRETSTHLFKFHGEVAMHLFLNDEFKLPSRVDICVERKKLLEIIKVIPKAFVIKYYDKLNDETQSEAMSLSQIAHVEVLKENTIVLNVFVYDVTNDEWVFRLDNNIRLPKNNIYFHSLSWNVDYIKPEIVLMYDLMDDQNYHQFSNYKAVIDALSYYQFYILKLVVGERRIQEAIIHNKKIS
ncbi:hypothetical protein JHX96_03450 [Staphylococcus saccharolyticus]|uniref:hypothetical protein n=1 Tax=Staphylococcus saccharolyticus TaxID=33028 RepID=UPI00102DDF49|nr:hypothetical protein [Staphylococcus saccharolyticus]MBL7583939.1 hypothetical protein [Staphylococcus saccharolyticus]MBL7638742.1 hypothetical protein [Staphylococcus saccharolyticus]QRJ67768.1 hypothetical protein DMB75_007030 [Staphylococcus saccharolyticus]TAA93653.1 hypothetical protein DMB74_03470 [Staphylococcus saccharolyticus]TAA94618.1 hypothetical protein DMB77_03470 [Staphylococcus saccharolyticus]